MIILILLLYGVPVYLVFFHFKVVPLTLFWKVFLWVPPVVAAVFLWFALGRYTPFAQDAYVQAPVVQVAPEVGGFVTEVHVKDNQEVKAGDPLFQIDARSYQYKVDQAKAKLIEVQQGTAALLASVYAAEETLGKAETGLVVAQKNVSAAQKDFDAAQKVNIEIKKQLEFAEAEANRTGRLASTNAASRDEYEKSLRAVSAQRAQMIDAQNTVSRADTAREIAALQATTAEAAVREAQAFRAKAEVQVDPARTFSRAVKTGEAKLAGLKRDSASATRVSELSAELDRMREYLRMAEEIGPFLHGEYAGVRQAKEALNDATLALEQTTVKAPAAGVITNLQLTVGSYARPATPVVSLIDTTHWRLVAAVPENWLELVKPGDEVTFSLRNYPGRMRSGKLEYIGRGVVQGQGVPSGILPDTDPRRVRQTDTPQAGQEFQVIVPLEDNQADQPLRVGSTGRMTAFASGGFPVVSGLAMILHTIFSFLDYLHPKPSPLVVLVGIAVVAGVVVFFRRSASK